MSEQKVALVTGALGGIGSEICRQLVTAGYKIIATVVPREEDREKQWLKDEGFTESDVRFVLTNLNEHEAATAAIQEAIDAEGRVDVLVNNAGITRDATFKKMSYTQWSEVIETNLKTLFTVTQPVFNKMFSVHDKFHRTLILSGFCFLKIAKISLNSSFFPKPIKR